MAGTKKTSAPIRAKLIVPFADAVAKVQTQLDKGEAIPRNSSINDSEDAHRWYEYTCEMLKRICNTDELSDQFAGVGSWGTDISVNSYLKRLRSVYDRLELFADDKSRPEQELASSKAPARAANSSRRVFIVHGQEDGLKETVARLLTRLELEPIVLHEQPNRGLTIIEKFESHSDVAFAVALLTPDDVGYRRDHASEARPRARQNVILELGFFLGAIGRSRVCVLYTKGVEVPSDYSGVVYIEVDERAAWRLQLAHELKAAEIAIDMNKCF